MKMLWRLSREAIRYRTLYVVTFLGVLVVLLTINPKLALITCAPIPLILVSGVIFSRKPRQRVRCPAGFRPFFG